MHPNHPFQNIREYFNYLIRSNELSNDRLPLFVHPAGYYSFWRTELLYWISSSLLISGQSISCPEDFFQFHRRQCPNGSRKALPTARCESDHVRCQDNSSNEDFINRLTINPDRL